MAHPHHTKGTAGTVDDDNHPSAGTRDDDNHPSAGTGDDDNHPSAVMLNLGKPYTHGRHTSNVIFPYKQLSNK